MVDHDLGEVGLVRATLGSRAPALGCAQHVHQLVVLIDGEDAMGRQALDREGSRDADARGVRVRLVVEIFELGFGGDRGVDLLLPLDPRLPPSGMEVPVGFRPIRPGLSGDFPFLPSLIESGVQLLAQRLQSFLEPLPDHVDLNVVGDHSGSDVRHALVHEALADVAPSRGLGRCRTRDFRFLALPLHAVGEQVVWIARAHDPRPGQS